MKKQLKNRISAIIVAIIANQLEEKESKMNQPTPGYRVQIRNGEEYENINWMFQCTEEDDKDEQLKAWLLDGGDVNEDEINELFGLDDGINPEEQALYDWLADGIDAELEDEDLDLGGEDILDDMLSEDELIAI